jgi:DNA repair protein RecN (Recombination protein N)
MLLSLSIKNFILIEQLELNFAPGFAVVSGETGAGKSIIIDALNLALGARLGQKILKKPDLPAVISAEFVRSDSKLLAEMLEEQGITENQLLIKRVIHPDGRSKAFINDTPVSISFLQKVSEYLLEIAAQHDQRDLFEPSLHREMLDQFAGLENKLKQLADLYKSWKSIEDRLLEVYEARNRSLDEKNYLSHIIKEIEDLASTQNEEEELSLKRQTLRDADKIKETARSVIDHVNSPNGIVDMMNSVAKSLARNSQFFHEAESYFERALIEIEEGGKLITSMLRDIDSNGASLEQIEDRLFKIRAIARKNNILPNMLPDYLKQCQAKLFLFENNDDLSKQLEQEVKVAKEAFYQLAKEISADRAKASERLRADMVKEFKFLKMENADFRASINELADDKCNQYGIDQVQFQARTNPGTAFANINKVASGGELSRILLAAKLALANVTSPPTIIFDEIDVGVGGAVADSIGKKLSVLSKRYQVIAITHQPQVAAYSTNHFLVVKKVENNQAEVEVHNLSKEEKLKEIARMLSGDAITDASMAAAAALIEQAA